jgi:AcrR family transcriptional regulator
VQRENDVKMETMTGSSRVYGGVDASTRAAQRRSTLIEAGLDLLGTTEPDISVRGVCRIAGVTSRYFYESFADKDALMEAVYDHVVEGIATAILTGLSTAGPTAPERVHTAVQTVVRLIAEDPRRGRLLFSATPGNNVLAAKREQSTAMFTALLSAQASEFYETEPDDRLNITAQFVVGGFAQVLTVWLSGGLALSEEDVTAYCSDLLLAAGAGYARRE